MLTALATYTAIAHALGGYNIGRFLLRKGVEKRRERKAQAARDAKVDELVDEVLGIRERLVAGKLDPARVKAVKAMVEAALADATIPAVE